MKHPLPFARRVANALLPRKQGPNTYYGKKVAEYVADRESDARWSAEAEVVSSLLAKMPKGLRVLDVPVGTGRFFAELAKVEAVVTAIDISNDMLKFAKKSAEAAGIAAVDFRRRPANRLSLQDASVDLALCIRFFGMLEVPLATAVIKEFRRVVQPQGTLVLYYPFRAELASSQEARASNKMAQKLESEILDLLAENGFELSERFLVGEVNDTAYAIGVFSSPPVVPTANS